MPRIENELAAVEKSVSRAKSPALRQRKKIEHMWRAIPVLGGPQPHPVPVVGSTWTRTIKSTAKRIWATMGFARHSSSQSSVSREHDCVVLKRQPMRKPRARSNPFAFKRRYLLAFGQNTYHHLPDRQSFPADDAVYSFGLHPAFNCPMMQGERFEDYKLVFACPETLTTTHGRRNR